MKIIKNKKFYFILFLYTVIFAQGDFSLEDINPTSEYYGQNIGTSYFSGQVTLHYFGHYNWGTCTARFGQLNDLYEDLLEDGYSNVSLVGIGKSQHLSSLSNWTNANDASVCADGSANSTWSDWGASQRELFVLDHLGNVVLEQNVGGGLPGDLEELIIQLINKENEH